MKEKHVWNRVALGAGIRNNRKRQLLTEIRHADANIAKGCYDDLLSKETLLRLGRIKQVIEDE